MGMSMRPALAPAATTDFNHDWDKDCDRSRIVDEGR